MPAELVLNLAWYPARARARAGGQRRTEGGPAWPVAIDTGIAR